MAVGRQLRLCTSHCSKHYRLRGAADSSLGSELGALKRNYNGDELHDGGRRARHVHRTGQSVLGCRINEVQRFVEIFILIHINLINPIRQYANGRSVISK